MAMTSLVPRWRQVVKNLLPSWYTSHHCHRADLPLTTTANIQQHSTEYMSGLRGIASLLVFIHHYPKDYFLELKGGYGVTPAHKSIFLLPFIRVIHSGSFMVSLFFVLSGYVLAHKALQQAANGNRLGLVESLSSSVFRRFIRLYLPIVPVTFLAMICQHMGIYDSAIPKQIHIVRPDTFAVQFKQWCTDLSLTFDFYNSNLYSPMFGTQLWTLPVEFRGSMLVFLCVLGLSTAKPMIKLSVMVLLSSVTFYTVKNWDMFLFLSGMMLSEMKIVLQQTGWSWETCLGETQNTQVVRYVTRSFWIVCFAFSLLLAGWPDDRPGKSLGYATLTSMTPAKFYFAKGVFPSGILRFWTSLAAVMMLSSLENLPLLHVPLNSAFCRYLGDISFALYLVHIPILYTFGRYLTLACISTTGSTAVGFCMAAIVVVPFTFWVSDLYWRFVDVKSVSLARWLWIRCSVSK